jgi:hypothetical protein
MQTHLSADIPANGEESAVSGVSVTGAALRPDSRGLVVLLFYLLMVIVFWPDLCEAVRYLRHMSDRWEISRTARHAAENLDFEYERLVDLHR